MNVEFMHDAVKDTARCLNGARLIFDKVYPEGNAPANLLPALIVAVAITWAARALHEDDAE